MATSLHVGTLPRIPASKLSQLILSHISNDTPSTFPDKVAIIDVRDDDHIGGHIKHSTHAPSSTLDIKIPELVRKLQDKEIVIFHCALSQVRGPSAALRYVRERQRLLGKGSTGAEMKKNKGDELQADTAGEWEDVDERKEQQVYVLEGGFSAWQRSYGEDARLTEGYRKEIWAEENW